jgi:hypothetical protein
MRAKESKELKKTIERFFKERLGHGGRGEVRHHIEHQIERELLKGLGVRVLRVLGFMVLR